MPRIKKQILLLLFFLSLCPNIWAQSFANTRASGYAVLDSITFSDIKRSCIPGIGTFFGLLFETPVKGVKPEKRYCKLYKNGAFEQTVASGDILEKYERFQEERWFELSSHYIHAIETLYYCEDTATHCDTLFMNVVFRGIGAAITQRTFKEDMANLTKDIKVDTNGPLHFPKHKYRAVVVDCRGKRLAGRLAAVNDRSLFLVIDHDEWHEGLVEIPYRTIYAIGAHRKEAPALGVAVGMGIVVLGFASSAKMDSITQTKTLSPRFGWLLLGGLATSSIVGFKKKRHRIDAGDERFQRWRRKKFKVPND